MRKVFLFIIFVYSQSAQAGIDVLFNENRQGYNSYLKKDYENASNKFSDNSWLGLSKLKEKKYDDAIVNLQQDTSIRGKYNLGNAYALKGDYDNAIAMYEEVLSINSNHEDAKYNLELVKKLKEQQQSQDKSDQDQNKDEKQTDEQSDNSQNSEKQDSKEQEKKDSKNEEQNKQGSEQNSDQQDKQNTEDQNRKEESVDNTSSNSSDDEENEYNEKQQADEQWLRSIPDDPGGLLKQKFLRDHLQRKGR